VPRLSRAPQGILETSPRHNTANEHKLGPGAVPRETPDNSNSARNFLLFARRSCLLRFHRVANVRYMKRDFCKGVRVRFDCGYSTVAAQCAGIRPAVPGRTSKFGYRHLGACAAMMMALAGCSNEPLPPQGALWTGSANARTGPAAATFGGSSSVAAQPARRASNGQGWGPYSGRRGQTQPPASTDYAFKGDPNAVATFAGRPGQM